MNTPALEAVKNLELTFLEQIFADDCKCQSMHIKTGPCSVEVTHLFQVSCQPIQKRICLVAATRDLSKVLCASCMNPAVECWTIRPI